MNTQPICLLEQGIRGSFVVRVCHDSQTLVLEYLNSPNVFFCNAGASHVLFLSTLDLPNASSHRHTICQLASKDTVDDHHQLGRGEELLQLLQHPDPCCQLLHTTRVISVTKYMILEGGGVVENDTKQSFSFRF